MPTQQKIDAVAEMKRLFDESSAVFVTDYQGLNVSEVTKLRTELRTNNVRYLVAKNTLMKLAAEDSGYGEIAEFLIGPTAIAFTSEDAAVAAKILNDSFKERELPRMKVFVVDKKQYDASDIKALADLPSRDVLLAQVLAAVEAPFSQLVGSLDGFFRELVGTIDALEEQRKSEG